MTRWLVASIVLAAVPARADVVAGLFGDSAHLGGVQAASFGANIELASHGRAQVFGEAALAYLMVGVPTAPEGGVHARLGAGARWLPATFGDDDDGIDLYVDGGIGASGYWWSGNRVVRPDLSFGWGFQIRARTRHHLILLRSGMRAMLAHDQAGVAIACRGCIVSPPQTIDGGLMAFMEFSW